MLNICLGMCWTSQSLPGLPCCNELGEAGVTSKSWRTLDGPVAQHVKTKQYMTISLSKQQAWQNLHSCSDHAGETWPKIPPSGARGGMGLPLRRKLQGLPNLAPSQSSFHVTAAASLFLTEGFVIAGLS